MKAHGRVGRCGVGISMLATGWAAFMVLALPLSTTETAQGDIVSLHVAGTVTIISSPFPGQFDLDGSVSVGSPYQLTFVIDTDVPDIDPDPARGVFLLVSASGQVGNYMWSRTGSPVNGIEVVNDLGGIVDEYDLGPQDFEIDGEFLVGGVPTRLTNDSFEFIFAGIDLTDRSGNVIDSDALVIPSLGDWSESGFIMHLTLDEAATGINSQITIQGSVDGITTPEPGAATVMGAILAAYTLRRRDRDQSLPRETRSSA